MTTAQLDLLELAEAVAAGRMASIDAERRIRAAAPGVASADATIAELAALVDAARAVRQHALATRAARDAERAAADAETGAGQVAPTRVRARVHGRAGRERALPRRRPAGLLLAAALTVALAAIAASLMGGLRLDLRPAESPSPSTAVVASPSPSASGPGPSASAGPSSSLSPSATPAPSSSPAVAAGIPAIASVPLPGAPGVAVWRMASPTRLEVIVWRSGGSDETLFETSTWADGTGGGQVDRQVIASPAGDRVAIVETDGQARTRLRVFTRTGALVWQGTRTNGIPALAWSADGGRLAIAFVPGPWLVLQWGAPASPFIHESPAPDGLALQLLGFTADGNSLLAYESSGEAAPWEKPYALAIAADLGLGSPEALAAYPAAPNGIAAANTTSPSRLIDPVSGRVLDPGGLSGLDTGWTVRSAGAPIHLATPVSGAVGSTSLAWSRDGVILALETSVDSAAGGSPEHDLDLGTIRTPAEGAAPDPAWGPGPGLYDGRLLAGADGYALVGLRETPAADATAPGDTELVLVELATGRASTFATGLGPGDLSFAGLVSR